MKNKNLIMVLIWVVLICIFANSIIVEGDLITKSIPEGTILVSSSLETVKPDTSVEVTCEYRGKGPLCHGWHYVCIIYKFYNKEGILIESKSGEIWKGGKENIVHIGPFDQEGEVKVGYKIQCIAPGEQQPEKSYELNPGEGLIIKVEEKKEEIKKEGEGEKESLSPTTTPPTPQTTSEHPCERNSYGTCEPRCEDDDLIWDTTRIPEANCRDKEDTLICCARNKDEKCQKETDAQHICLNTTKGGFKEDSCKDNLCPGGAEIKCCIPLTCADYGGEEVLEAEAKEKCLDEPYLPFDPGKGKVCCKTKEKKRELVKKPGTLGRLNSCFGKYWLWGKQDPNSFIEKAEKHIEDAVKKGIDVGGGYASPSTLLGQIQKSKEKIKEIESIQEKANELDKINTDIFEVRKQLAKDIEGLEKGELGEKEKISQISKLKDADKDLSQAQDELEKARSVVAMTWTEVAANMISCLTGMTYASQLAFGNAGMGGVTYLLGLGGGIVGNVWSRGDLGAIASVAGGGAIGAAVATRGDNEIGSCLPETPLKGTDACLSCNEDPFRLCTRERCAILGNCIAVPTAKGDQYNCIPGKCEEVGIPLFTWVNVSWFIDGELNGSITKDYGKGANINIDISKERYNLPFNTKTILINLTTDKPAQCRYVVDVKGANFSDMQDFEDNYFPLDPVTGKPGWQHAAVLLPGDMARNATHRVFIKCKNACGVEPSAAYDSNIISFTFEKKPDQLPPEIVYVDPAPSSMIRGDLAFVNVSIWLDELGSCKFSDKSNNYSINYTASPPQGMIPFGSSWNNENSSVIASGCARAKCLDRNEQCSRCWLLLNTSRGYDIVNFSSTEFNETKLFSMLIRCADTAGNVMVEDSILSYTLMTAPVYNISIIKPEHGNKTYDRKPEIEVTSEPRQTECRYRIFQTNRVPREELATMGGRINCESLNWSLMWPIDVGMSTLHKGRHNETLNATPSGLLHTLCVKCRDTWQIEESDRSDFYVLLDPTPPIVVRMYHDTTAGDYLIIETDEESECVYGTSDTVKCNYNFSDGSAMTTTNNYLHAAYWQLNSLYYIKCKDKWDNYAGGSSNANQCTIVINPFEIPPTI